MSRTNKDKPHHARATWWEPDHWRCPHHIPVARLNGPPRECDLPGEPIVSDYDKTARHGPSRTWQCTWQPVWDRHDGWRYGRRAVPKWFVDHVWNSKNRTAERAHGRRVIAEYRATGDVDTVLPAEQHRHRAQWLFW